MLLNLLSESVVVGYLYWSLFSLLGITGVWFGNRC